MAHTHAQAEVISDLEDEYVLFTNVEYPWGEDPFIKEGGHVLATKESIEAMKISAIIDDRQDPRAIVDGRMIRQQDKLQGRTVRKIGSNHLLLEKGHSIIEVQMGSGEEGNGAANAKNKGQIVN
ncbi:MAG: hypothetical protein HQK50_18855, partial [Oligoflexia bacterium]|nr:hypothetical protein [Oligoflexia bacterium]